MKKLFFLSLLVSASSYGSLKECQNLLLKAALDCPVCISGLVGNENYSEESVPLHFPIVGLTPFSTKILSSSFPDSDPNERVQSAHSVSYSEIRTSTIKKAGIGDRFFNYNQAFELLKDQVVWQYVQRTDEFDRELTDASKIFSDAPTESFALRIYSKNGKIYNSEVRRAKGLEFHNEEFLSLQRDFFQDLAKNHKTESIEIEAYELLHTHPVNPFMLVMINGTRVLRAFDLSPGDIESLLPASRSYPDVAFIVTAISPNGFKYSIMNQNGKSVTLNMEEILKQHLRP